MIEIFAHTTPCHFNQFISPRNYSNLGYVPWLYLGAVIKPANYAGNNDQENYTSLAKTWRAVTH